MTAAAPFGHPRAGIACPGCGLSPRVGTMWVCAPDGCGAAFDTFATQGRCPNCDARFTWTQCPHCHRSSAHEAWYVVSVE
jgi:hypothetical protein